MRLIKQLPQSGFTLLEVMIAVAILAVGMLGIAGLHIVSLENTNDAFLRSQAVTISQDIIERMRSNREQVRAGTFNSLSTDNISNAPEVNCSANTTGCNNTQLATFDIYQWALTVQTVNDDNKRRQLPEATATVTSDDSQLFEVKIKWQTKQWVKETDTPFQRKATKANYSFKVAIN
ncbi:type IV pilus modification protein PilV [Psychrobium sp. 1_MG-2023]|uniref:type IV pilus modification protein PilV n=1 Tax=Psychrobium sp. 1_MG-2023 TaxID=3062624 RepID=UPI000C339E96|nr:type IV pilus modification protein PilV [Psychrobium sp. 1_MG-2023]MDP2561853.1 type IV pilus modification protein PilV [Psychrobium sp. 1_MG-2023]PKF55777.1 type IV pilus modification protein PilV [Alteromonadales bacterium alter-6D02]